MYSSSFSVLFRWKTFDRKCFVCCMCIASGLTTTVLLTTHTYTRVLTRAHARARAHTHTHTRVYNENSAAWFILETEKCDVETCRNSGTCTNTATGVHCTCPNGYTGATCETGKLLSNCLHNYFPYIVLNC